MAARTAFLFFLIIVVISFIAASGAYANRSKEEIINSSKELKILKQHVDKLGEISRDWDVMDRLAIRILGSDIQIKSTPKGLLSLRLKEKKSTNLHNQAGVILDSLGRIVFIGLRINYLKNLEFFSQFKQLRSLSLFKVKRFDNDSILVPKFQNLEELSITWSLFTNFTVGEVNEKLRYLTLQGNSSINISFISKFPNLIYMDLYNSKAKKINNLHLLKHLEWLSLMYSSLIELPSLDNFEKLKYLDISATDIEYLPGLGKLKKITHLELNTNSVKNIAHFPVSLKWLSASRGELHQKVNFDKLSRLKTLFLVGNNLEDIPFLPKLKSLEKLVLSGNPITKLTNLKFPNSLQELLLSDCNISKIEGLGNLTNLKILGLTSNPIEKIEGLEKLVNLEELILRETKITKFEGIKYNKKLKLISLENSTLADYDPAKYDHLKDLTISITSTPIYKKYETGDKELYKKYIRAKRL